MKKHGDTDMSVKTKKLFVCGICKKKFASKIEMKHHLNGHTAEGTKTADDSHIRFMAENFDMTCDLCETTFISFRDARSHYRHTHDDKKGYVKCCNTKLRKLWMVTDHINSHLNPYIYRYVFVRSKIKMEKINGLFVCVLQL